MKLFVFLLAPVIALSCSGCSKPTSEELFAEAREAQKQGKFPLAIEHYSTVLREYPASAVAETAMFVIATIRQNDTHEFPEAVKAFKRYVESYPEGGYAAISTFLIGFIYNNELHNLDSASAAYRTFLAKYPRHEMAQSAQFELDNLGKSPEVLLPKDVASEPRGKKGDPARPAKKVTKR